MSAEPPGPAAAGADDPHAVAGRALTEVAAAADLVSLEAARSRYLGRSDGLLSARRKGLGAVADAEVRRQLGQTLNALINRVEQALDERHRELEAAELSGRLEDERLDLTLPPPVLRRGHLHPITRCLREIRRIFASLGYTAVGAPEVEWDRYNFSLVNMPPGHPSRATQDTFFIDEQRVLRTHTSPGQIRSMISLGAPLRVIVPGKAFRRDYDATHFPMFHQVEGLCVDIDISLGDLKGTLEYYARSLFGSTRAVRLRPHHFEFTEPSIEVDVSCMVCGGDGCRTCRGSGWIEMLGGGMVHPQVLRNGGVDPEVYSGFAFGIGVDRVAQLLYDIDDGRQLFENDLRFLREA
ncbi:MAG: phenylalanine--tRNA ligase subunit alpha [Candidatus Dormibacteria bacterium]